MSKLGNAVRRFVEVYKPKPERLKDVDDKRRRLERALARLDALGYQVDVAAGYTGEGQRG